CSPVLLVQLRMDNTTGHHRSGVQPHHLLVCDALGSDHAWYEVPSQQEQSAGMSYPLECEYYIQSVVDRTIHYGLSVHVLSTVRFTPERRAPWSTPTSAQTAISARERRIQWGASAPARS